MGKLKVKEGFKTFSFDITNCSAEEKENVMNFLKSQKHFIKIILLYGPLH